MSSTVEEMFRYYTNRAGELSRNLALVGAGIIWLLHGKVSGGNNELLTKLDWCLTAALILIVVSLALDVTQYIVGVIQWGSEFKRNPGARANTKETPVNIAVGFIFTKLASMAIAYGFIVAFIIGTPMF